MRMYNLLYFYSTCMFYIFTVVLLLLLLLFNLFRRVPAAGPSGLRVQHLLDVASIPLPITICSLLSRVVNLLVSGKVPQEVSRFMAGGSLTALSKLKPGCALDIRPIAVGEVLRRLAGKCLCAVIKHRVIDFYEPIQFGVACLMGSEKVIHGIRACVDKHWNDIDFFCSQGGFQECIQFSLQRCCFTGMHKAFSRFASLGGFVLWLLPFFVSPYGPANIIIRCAAGRPTGSFSVFFGLA